MSASISTTFSKLLGTIGTTADAATKIVDNAASGLDMLDMYVRTAKEKQEARTVVDMATFYDDLHKESALENALKAEALERELQSNATLHKHYQTELANLETVIDKIKNKYQTVI